MHVAAHPGAVDLVQWTKRPLLLLAGYAVLIVSLYCLTDGPWISLPWSVLTLLGLTLAISAGFKAAHNHARGAEARRVWASIAAVSRNWSLLAHGVLYDPAGAQVLVRRQLAWLQALRYRLRCARAQAGPGRVYAGLDGLRRSLQRHVGAAECERILAAGNMPGQVLRLQGEALRELLGDDGLHPAAFLEMHRLLHEMQVLQAAAERMQLDPLARRMAAVNAALLWTFGLLLPLGLLDALAPLVLFDGPIIGTAVAWSIVPLSVLVGGLYMALDGAGRAAPGASGGDTGDAAINALCASLEDELMAAVAATRR